MRKRIILMAGFLALVMIFAGSIQAQATRVAVLGFEAADSRWFESNRHEEEMLENISDEFNDKLSNTGEYTVLNRGRIKDLYDEINTRPGQRPTHSIINQLRGRTNADLFAYGSIDRIDVDEIDEFRIGPVRFSEVELTVELSVEMINARNPRSSDTYTGTGRIIHTGINIVDSSGDRIRLQAFDDDALDRTISRAIDNLIANITGEDTDQDKEIIERTVEAEVVSIVGDRLVINKGSRDGLKVGQTGDIVRYSTTSAGTERMQNVGRAEISELDRNSGFADSYDLNLSPQEGDFIRFITEEEAVVERKDPVKVLNLRDFRIEIYGATQDGNRVTIQGRATSKSNNVSLEVILGVRDFHDHKNERRGMTGRRVSIGDWVNASSDTAKISETFDRNESKNISWSFTNVPTEADKISRVILWLQTEYEGTSTIELRDLKL